jgi:hypothetical protein
MWKEDDVVIATKEYMLTTVDNPWNPFIQWDEWYAFDQERGYDTPGFLARIAKISFELSEADQEQAINDAIDEIVQINALGIHRKVTEDGEFVP